MQKSEDFEDMYDLFVYANTQAKKKKQNHFDL